MIDTSTNPSNYNFESYGTKTSGSSLPSPFTYRGYYSDSETGLFYLNARYYDPTTQQFTQEDTYWGDTKDPATLNLYGYCQGNPVMYTDPSGHSLEQDMAEYYSLKTAETGLKMFKEGRSGLTIENACKAKQTILAYNLKYPEFSYYEGATSGGYTRPKPTPTPTPTPTPIPWLIPSNVQAQNEKMISTLVPELQSKARRFLIEANNKGYALFIIVHQII